MHASATALVRILSGAIVTAAALYAPLAGAQQAASTPPATLRIGIIGTGNIGGALETASRLVRDAGFDPVVVGGLSEARRFNVGTSVYVKLLDAAQLRAELKLP